MPPTLSQLSTWTVMLLRSMSSISSSWLHNPELMPPLHPLPLLSFPSFSLPSWFVDIHAGVPVSVRHIHLLLPFLQALGKAELSHCFHSIPPTLSHPIPSSKVMKPVSEVTSIFLGSDLKVIFFSTHSLYPEVQTSKTANLILPVYFVFENYHTFLPFSLLFPCLLFYQVLWFCCPSWCFV